MKKKRGQAAIEFLFSAGIVFFIFLILMFMTFAKTKEVRDLQNVLDKKSECQRIANLINGIFINSEGSSVSIITHYNVTIEPKSIFVEAINKSWQSGFMCRHLAKVNEITLTGNVSIRKEGIGVVISNG
ncbi:MAG: hypothetical protein ABIB71_00185 [Candidatus Woesearchaeota archaeon]